MSAQVEEAVLHESGGILKWGWFGGRRGFYGQPGLVAEVELGLWWARGHFHTARHHAKNQDDPDEESS